MIITGVVHMGTEGTIDKSLPGRKLELTRQRRVH